MVSYSDADEQSRSKERTRFLEKERKRGLRSVHFDNPPDVNMVSRDIRPPRASHWEPPAPAAGQKQRDFWAERVPRRQSIQVVERPANRSWAYRNPFAPDYTNRSRASPRTSDGEDPSESEDTWPSWDDAYDELEQSDQESSVRAHRRQISEPEAPRKRVDIVYDPSQAARDITVRLQMDIEEDVGLDLDELCRLRRLGRCKDAKAHFKSKLEYFGSRYFQLLYAEMLLTSGDYKTFESLPPIPQFLPASRLGPDQTPEDRYGWNLVATNYGLLDVISQGPEPLNIMEIQHSVHGTLKTLSRMPIECSTEVQLLAMCFRVLQYLERCKPKSMLGEEQESPLQMFDWKQVYHELLGEGCVWDFRDLFVSATSVFGWDAFTLVLFGTSSVDRALDIIVNDWTGALYDEPSTLGLLDLFTSRILQDLSDGAKAQNSLLLEEARVLAESAQEHNKGLMRSRPFIQWLLAKSALEMEGAPEGPDGVRLEDFRGLLIYQGEGLHLPIYVPSHHTDKPTWEMLSKRSPPAARRAAEVAAAAAHDIGDYDLQAVALKLLILQSQDPKRWMAALAHLQLDAQGDKDGYLATCLSRYLVSTEEIEEMVLLRDIKKLGAEKGNCENTSLLWASDLICTHLTFSGRVSGTSNKRNPVTTKFEETCNQRSWHYPRYIVDFARKELAISGSPHTPEFNPTSHRPFGFDPAPVNHRFHHGHHAVPVLPRRHPANPPPPPPPPAPRPQGPTPEPTKGWHEDMKRVWDEYKGRPKSPAVPASPSQTQGQKPKRERVDILETTDMAPSHTYNTSGQSHQTPRRQRSYDKVRGWLQIDGAREGEYGEPAGSGEAKNKAGQKSFTGKLETPGKTAGKGPSGSSREKGEPTQNQRNSKARHNQEQQGSNTGDDSPNAGKAQGEAVNDEQQTRAEEKRDGNDGQNDSITPSDAVNDEKHMQTEESGHDNGGRNASKAPGDAGENNQPMRVEEGQNGLTKLQFSRDLLEDNHMAVVVWDRRGLQGTKTYIVDEVGVSEAKRANLRQSTGAAEADTGGLSPTIKIRTEGDRIDTTNSGRSTGERQSGIDEVKRAGNGEAGKLRDSQRGKREKRDRWDEFWFSPGEGVKNSEPTHISTLQDPLHYQPNFYGSRSLRTETESKYPLHYQSGFYGRKYPLHDQYSFYGGRSRKTGAEGFKPNPEEKTEEKGKEKEVVDRRASVAEGSQADEGSNDAGETVVREAKKVSGVASSITDDSSASLTDASINDSPVWEEAD